jgi:hypothetical protein
MSRYPSFLVRPFVQQLHQFRIPRQDQGRVFIQNFPVRVQGAEKFVKFRLFLDGLGIDPGRFGLAFALEDVCLFFCL